MGLRETYARETAGACPQQPFREKGERHAPRTCCGGLAQRYNHTICGTKHPQVERSFPLGQRLISEVFGLPTRQVLGADRSTVP